MHKHLIQLSIFTGSELSFRGQLLNLFICVLRHFNSKAIYIRHPHLLSPPKDVKLGKYTVLTGNRTPGRRVAVHYATAAPSKLYPIAHSR